MSCPSWRLLSSRRDRDPEAWERGLEHFDRCDRCRERALAAEPTLLFRELPAPAVGADEIAAMKRAVAVLRRSRRGSEKAPRRAPGPRRLPAALRLPPLLRAAALGLLVIGAAALQGGGREAGDAGGTSARADLEAAAETAARPWPVPGLLAVEDLPLVETADPTYASLVEVPDDEFSLVLVLPNDV